MKKLSTFQTILIRETQLGNLSDQMAAITLKWATLLRDEPKKQNRNAILNKSGFFLWISH